MITTPNVACVRNKLINVTCAFIYYRGLMGGQTAVIKAAVINNAVKTVLHN